MFKGYIYKCTCVISGKSYVGLTTKTIEERKKEHLHSSYNPNDNTYKTHLHSAIRKYGIENFEWSIVEEIEGSDITTVIATLRGLEVKYVAFYDSFHNGYNLTPGGALNLDSHSISSCASGKYKYSGKIDSVKIVWKYI